MYTLYDSTDSGNAYKVRLALAHLGIAYEKVEMDTDGGETRTSEYLAKNPYTSYLDHHGHFLHPNPGEPC